MIIKICGVIQEEGVRLISESGADYLGLLVDMPSPRTLTPEKAAEFASKATIDVALLFYNKDVDGVARAVETARPAAVQLQGDDPPEAVAALRKRIGANIWKSVHLPAEGTGGVDVANVVSKMKEYADAGADRFLFDTFFMENGKKRIGGTGKTYNWDVAKELVAASPLPVILAGGLTPENVGEAIRATRPQGVDVASGVEISKGVKDPEKVKRFMRNAREAEKEVEGE